MIDPGCDYCEVGCLCWHCKEWLAVADDLL